MKICFILNPRAGRNRDSRRISATIQNFIAHHELDAELVFTEYPRHAIYLAKTAIDKGCDLVVACGGDGTVNEVAQSVTGTNVRFGIVPCGSGNGLARHLQIPSRPAAALDLLFSGEARAIDTGIANGQPFVNVMGAGFDAVLSERFNRLTRRGLLPYLRAAMLTFLTYRPSILEISTDGRRQASWAWLVAIANSSQYGNNAFIAPDAEVDDGQFNLVMVRSHRFWHVPELAFRLFRRSINLHPRVATSLGSDFVIQRAAPALIHTDGEPHMAAAEVVVRVIKNSLYVIVPIAQAPASTNAGHSNIFPNRDEPDAIVKQIPATDEKAGQCG